MSTFIGLSFCVQGLDKWAAPVAAGQIACVHKLPQRSQHALQFGELLCELVEFGLGQLACRLTVVSSAICQMQQLLDLIEIEPVFLSTLDETNHRHRINGIRPVTRRRPRRLRQGPTFVIPQRRNAHSSPGGNLTATHNAIVNLVLSKLGERLTKHSSRDLGVALGLTPTEVGGQVGDGEARGRWRTDTWLSAVLLSLAGLGWWWSSVSAGVMRGDGMSMDTQLTMSFAAFLVAWVAMIAAMMLPAVLPVVRLYARAAAADNAAPVVIFVAGYLAVWSAAGIPAFLAWSRLNGSVAHAYPWAGRFAGAVAVAAGLYQLTALKAVCLRHCRSPLSFFLRHGKHLDRPAGAFGAGGRHGIFCLGCCWMLMLLLIAFGTMQLAWMLALTILILLEKAVPFGDRLRQVTAVIFVLLGVVLLVHPTFVIHLV
jgi:predicted metal-binding membrane protein